MEEQLATAQRQHADEIRPDKTSQRAVRESLRIGEPTCS